MPDTEGKDQQKDKAGPPESRPGREAGAGRKRRGPSPALVFAAFALLLSLAALAAAGYLCWRGRTALQQQARMDRSLGQLSAALDRTNQALVTRQQFRSRIGSLQQDVQQLQQKLGATRDRLQNLEALTNGGRQAWQRDEVAYLLRTASQTLQLRHDPAAALQALQLADQRLKQMGDPRYLPVRKAIADEMTALRAVPRPDVTGMAMQLDSLSRHAQEWPLANPARPRPPGTAGSPATPSAAGPWWQRAWQSVVGVFRQMVVIRHHAKPIQPLVPPEEAQLVRGIAALRLDSARSALLRRDAKLYDAQLASARSWIERYFDHKAASVQAALAGLQKLQAAKLAPKLPDLSGSLEKLQHTPRPGSGGQGQ
ncbi:MAG TPA: uroporphyrinogen-III C-methyltransferase [Gammaproteobacteria bacterium]|nr:uroporphyrinogen-III C-methyltransferase [Gammaproteobacteria bacterium]